MLALATSAVLSKVMRDETNRSQKPEWAASCWYLYIVT